MTDKVDYLSATGGIPSFRVGCQVCVEARLDVEQAIPQVLKSLRLIESPTSGHQVEPPQTSDRVTPDAIPRVLEGVVELIPTLIVEEYITPRQAIAIRAVHRALGDLNSDGGA